MEPRLIKTSNRSTAARARVWRLQSDALLCDAAANGKELAFNELYRRHYRDLSAFVFHFLGARHRHEDAEDVVQDAFERAFDAIRDHHFDGDFRRWIFTIARNRSIDLLRGERTRLARPEPPVVGATAAATAETREEVAWLVAEIEKLPERQRSALLLRELAGLSHEAIGEELETTPASVRQLIARARDGMRSAAERDGREHAPLRRELIDAAAPAISLAATGIIAAAGTTAGGSMVFGKVLATVLATLIVAGTAGTISREVADASGAPDNTPTTKPLVSAAPGSSAHRGVDQTDKSGSGARLKSHSVDGALPEPKRHSSSSAPKSQGADGGSGEHDSGDQKPATQESAPEAAPSRPQPVKEVLELPGKVVENVTDGLSGSSPPDQVVGNVLTDVTDTLGETTSGLLGSGPGSGSH